MIDPVKLQEWQLEREDSDRRWREEQRAKTDKQIAEMKRASSRELLVCVLVGFACAMAAVAVARLLW